MIAHYIKGILRFWYGRHGSKSASRFGKLNLAGLAIGLFAFLVILHIVGYELGYDRHIGNGDSIFRVVSRKTDAGVVSMESARAWAGMPDILASSIPAVKSHVRFYKEECMLHYREKDIKFNRQHTFWADPSFMTMFGLEFLLEGDLRMMEEPWGAIISESAARRLFGDDWSGSNTPIGKTIYLNHSLGFTILGVFKDIPPNTHFDVDFVVSWSTLVSLAGPAFESSLPPDWNSAYVYLELASGADPSAVSDLVNKVMRERIPASAESESQYEFFLQPIRSIHLHSQLDDELAPNGRLTFVYGLSMAGLFIIIIVWINYVNLMTAHAFDRAKEVGVRRILGSSRFQITLRFLAETMVAGLLAGICGVAIFYLVRSPLRTSLYPDSPAFDTDGSLLFFFFAFVLLASLAAGIFPALTFTRTSVKEFVEGKLSFSRASARVRKGLIVVQFIAAIFLTSATMVLYWQLKYMAGRDLGMQPEQVVVVHSPRSMIGSPERARRFQTFKDNIRPVPGVESVSASSCLPGADFLVRSNHVRLDGAENMTGATFDIGWVEQDFFSALGAQLIAGRDFIGEPDHDRVIVNEAAARVLGCRDPDECIGRTLYFGERENRVIGVVESTHYSGLQTAVNPVLYFYGHDYEFGFFTIRFDPAEISYLTQFIAGTWADIYPNDPFDCFFLDSFFGEQYAREREFGKLFGSLTVAAITLACFGLVGLVSFSVSRRRKEIGVRKTLGANERNILVLVSADLSVPILIACGLTAPVAFAILSDWLDTFAYAFEFHWWNLLQPCCAVVSIAAMSIFWHVRAASVINPAEVLKEQ